MMAPPKNPFGHFGVGSQFGLGSLLAGIPAAVPGINQAAQTAYGLPFVNPATASALQVAGTLDPFKVAGDTAQLVASGGMSAVPTPEQAIGLALSGGSHAAVNTPDKKPAAGSGLGIPLAKPRMVTVGSGGTVTTTRTGKQPLPGLFSSREKIDAKKVGALKAGAKANIAASKQVAQILGEDFDLAQAHALAPHEAKIAKEQERREQAWQQLQAMRAEAADEKVDPDHWWSSRTGGQKAAMGIAMAIGGFMHGFSRGQIANTAAKMLDAEITRDLATQAANIKTKAGKRREAMGIVSTLDQKIGNLEKSREAARSMLIDDVNRRLKVAAARAQDPVLRAKLEAALAGVESKRLEQNNKDYQLAQPTVTTQKKSSWRRVPVGGSKAGGKALKYDKDTNKLLSEVDARADALLGIARSFKKHGGILGKASQLVGKYGPVDTEASAASSDRDNAIAIYLKWISGAAVKTEEVEREKGRWPKLTDSKTVAGQKYRRIFRKGEQRLMSAARQAAREGKDPRPILQSLQRWRAKENATRKTLGLPPLGGK